ncbi:hypothetical protein D9758_011930 [Tetrapyrgos nigripes]|uniref:Uncharacterized protein n=1 Tax=Tetrapyrgos nigripes TaxID=182062 RepID=A0A8H5FWF3_9AGAR|nr:hypothetical protein D9758_011930 [Tetrapyrgos nigripes]
MPLWNRGTSKRTEDFDASKRRTHTNPRAAAALKAGPLEVRLRKNTEIEKANIARRQKRLEHLGDPSKPDGSDTASLVTIEDHEFQHIRKSKTWREMWGDLLGSRFHFWANEEDAKEKREECCWSQIYTYTEYTKSVLTI